jgi:single-strand DNA-binding protein
MASLNKVFLVGNLTRDPELRRTPGGAVVCNFGLAVSRRYTTARGEDREDVCFVDIEAWGKWAEACKNYLAKGAPVLIEGRLRYDQWEDRETGQKRSRLSVTAERGQFLGAPSRGRGPGYAGDEAPPRPPPAEDAPSQPEPDAVAGPQEHGAVPESAEAAPEMPPFEEVANQDDDIPF